MKLTDIQEQWLEALESGEYAQTQAALRRNDSYCCLGVACDVSGLGEWGRRLGTDGTDGTDGTVGTPGPAAPTMFHADDGEVESYALPKAVRRHLRLIQDGVDYLVYMNDSDGWAFKEIAARVRRDPRRFFTPPSLSLIHI